MRARTLTALLTPALLLFGLAWGATPVSAGEAKVEICHFPPGNPDNFHTILISQSALPAHLSHGDVGDTCDAHCETMCDDGNACTIDACDSAGGCAAAEPTDCNDGDLCTTDSCDPVTGCGNECVDCTAPDLCTISACASDTGACVDTPVVCPDGEACNIGTGVCEPPVACGPFSSPPGLVFDGIDYAGSGLVSIQVIGACTADAAAQGCNEDSAGGACSFQLTGDEFCRQCLLGGPPETCIGCTDGVIFQLSDVIGCPRPVSFAQCVVLPL